MPADEHGIHEQAEFNLPVADDAGVGGKSLKIAVGKIVEHLFCKRSAQIDYVEGNAEAGGNRLNPFLLDGKIRLSEVHEKALDLILVAEEQGAGR